MNIRQSQVAPAFRVNDINGKTIDLAAYRGKKVLLSFHRFAGCPVCNLRVHELEREAGYFQSKGLVVLGVFESSNAVLKQYTKDGHFANTIISDTTEQLYTMYGVERSGGKVMKGLFNGAMGKMKQGKKLYTEKIARDGHTDRIGADFLIDEEGKIITAYYGKYLGDNLPLDSIKAAL